MTWTQLLATNEVQRHKNVEKGTGVTGRTVSGSVGRTCRSFLLIVLGFGGAGFSILIRSHSVRYWVIVIWVPEVEVKVADGVGIAPTQPGGSLGFRDRGITALPTIRNGRGGRDSHSRPPAPNPDVSGLTLRPAKSWHSRKDSHPHLRC